MDVFDTVGWTIAVVWVALRILARFSMLFLTAVALRGQYGLSSIEAGAVLIVVALLAGDFWGTRK